MISASDDTNELSFGSGESRRTETLVSKAY